MITNAHLVSLLNLPADIGHIFEELLDLVRVVRLVQIQARYAQHRNKI